MRVGLVSKWFNRGQPVVGRYLRSGRLVASFGDLEAAPGGGNPSQGFRVYALR